MSAVVPRPAILLLTPSALALAKKLAAALEGAEIYGYAPRVPDADVTFSDLGLQLEELLATGQPIIGLCAAGILIRKLAPLLDDKRQEPPVVAVAEDGSAVVPLLGGHHGANALAREIGRALGVKPAVTTAGDLRFGLALDEPPAGWRVGNPEAAKRLMDALLAGEPVRIERDEPRLEADWLAALPQDPRAQIAIRLTSRRTAYRPNELVLHPATVAIGLGCERGAPAEEMVALARDCLAAAEVAPASVALVGSIALKAAEPAIHAVAEALRVPARFFEAERLNAERHRLANPSDAVFAETGCYGVAEGAALAAVGPEGRLLVPKRIAGRVTCAIAEGPRVLDPAAIGRARGRLAIVGIGPGDAAGRTAGAEAALAAADAVVGYGLYLDLIAPLIAGKERHDFPLGEEKARARRALDLAAEGRRVALVSSGDAGIYAMGSLVFELVDVERHAGWDRLEIVGLPGVSAMQAAAAASGAPLGHDFCAISLSDLLTPWPAIEQRLEAAAAGDFVVALYNPVSERRRDQLLRAREILLRSRAATTPVVLARNLGRAGETVRVVELDALGPDLVDMLTIVIVGSSHTRRIDRPDGGAWVYTPRGYAAKPEPGR
jgi:cobalt-precorrin 5A hydrolase / cobalt-factor III methyltransferase / precorrin-3B C17-methyltransferase